MSPQAHSPGARRFFPDGLTTGAGLVTLAIGSGLVAAPERTAELLGLHTEPDAARLLGIVDLALAPALIIRGRHRGPAMVVRAGLNAWIAARYAAAARQPGGTDRAVGGAWAMGILAVVDGVAGIRLWRRRP